VDPVLVLGGFVTIALGAFLTTILSQVRRAAEGAQQTAVGIAELRGEVRQQTAELRGEVAVLRQRVVNLEANPCED
jgi:hypothetical protein